MDDEVERGEEDGFDRGREFELYRAEQRRDAPAVGAAVRCSREAIGLTIAEVAERAGVDEDYLDRFERGDLERLEEGESLRSVSARLTRILGEWMAERPA